jgi:hypothetical protein
MAAADNGWGREAIQPPSVWIRLKSKDESVKFRIAAMPLREVTIFSSEQGEPPIDKELTRNLTPGQWLRAKSSADYDVKESFPLLVIDRLDGQPKIYRVSSAIYTAIRKYATDPEWGDPRGYDITITRTEKPGTYWEIKPSPNKTNLMQSELDKVMSLDIEKLLPDARPANQPQIDDIADGTNQEDLPWEKHLTPRTPEQEAALLAQNENAPAPAPGPEKLDVVIEDIGDEPVNLDDIPF